MFIGSLILSDLVFFLLQDGDKAWNWLVEPVDGWRAEAITSSGRVALDRVGGYLRGTTVLAAINAVTEFVFMFVLGVPLAGPLAVLVFLGTYIPYLGGFVTTLMILLVTLSSLGTTATLIMLVLLAIRNLVVSNIIRLADLWPDPGRPPRARPRRPAGRRRTVRDHRTVRRPPVLAFAMSIAPSVILALGLEPDERPANTELVPILARPPRSVELARPHRRGPGSRRRGGGRQHPLVIVPVVLSIVLAATLDPTADAPAAAGVTRRALAPRHPRDHFVILAISAIAILMMVGPLQEMLDLGSRGASQSALALVSGSPQVVQALRSRRP